MVLELWLSGFERVLVMFLVFSLNMEVTVGIGGSWGRSLSLEF